jgi:hypothetical protein
MDLTKFLSLIENRCLLFPRADQFNDPYEGRLARAGVLQLRDQAAKAKVPPAVVDQLLNLIDVCRRQIYISCWFASEHESAAMWKLYLQSPEGIAIRTDHDTLTAALEKSPLTIRTTMVKYVDYDKVSIAPGNFFFPFVHKRSSFEHERELRAIIWSEEPINKSQISDETTSVQVDIVPQKLVKSVHVSPTAPKWFGRLVEQVLKHYTLTIPVVRSGLYDRPTY